MHIIRHSPRGLAHALRRDLSRTSRSARQVPHGPTDRSFPSADVYELADRYVIEADLPGIDPAAVAITLEAGVLEVSGQRDLAQPADQGVARRTERSRGAFERRFVLPESAAAEGVEARYRDGVLTISIPKVAAAVSRRIEVQAA